MNRIGKASKSGNPDCSRILYEDESVTAVYKAPGVLSQSDSTGDPDILTLLKERYQKTESRFVGLVHRIDRPACGVMMFARTPESAASLSQQLREHRFGKTYLAVVHGHPPDESVLEDLLEPGSQDRKTIVSNSTGTEKITAELYYRILAEHLNRSLLEIQLFTGRKHQIRAQLSHRGFPIVGDRKYGSREVLRHPGMIALCSWKLECEHPVTKQVIHFQSPRPQHWPWHDPCLFGKEGGTSEDIRHHRNQMARSDTGVPPKGRQKRRH